MLVYTWTCNNPPYPANSADWYIIDFIIIYDNKQLHSFFIRNSKLKFRLVVLNFSKFLRLDCS